MYRWNDPLPRSIVRPYGLYITHETPRIPEKATFGLKSRARQHALVHQIAQRTAGQAEAGSLLNFRYSGNGYHYQADEVRRLLCRLAAKPIMPIEESISVLETADRIRTMISNQARTEG